MSSSNKHGPRVTDNTCLPYTTSVNPVTRTETPYLAGGSNTLCLASAPLTIRPGFVPSVSQFSVNAQVLRIFDWQRWAGAFFTIYSVVDAVVGASYVYAGTTLIFTDPASTEPFDYVVSNNFLFFANGSTKGKWDGSVATNWGIVSPVAAPTIVNAAAGNVPSVIGHRYVFAYGVSTTGYVSDISDTSASTSVVNRQWDVTGARSSDTQCDQVHIYRTEDGGATLYELSNSPIANPATPTWTIRDNDFDVTSTSTPRLQGTVQAPFKSINQPPTSLKGLKYWAGRIWGFVDDVLKYSGLEEVANSVPEECFGTLLTNSQAFGKEITGLAVLGGIDTSILLVFTSSTIFFVSGTSLATFRIGILANHRGCRNRATIVTAQITKADQTVDFVAWLDTTNTVRLMTVTSGASDISFDIRSDIQGIDHSRASMTVHEDGVYRWLILCDGGHGSGDGNLRVLDLDTGRWNTPWPIFGISAIHSGETSTGVLTLSLGILGRVLTMDYLQCADEGVPYTASAIIGLTSLLNPDNPEQVATLEFVGIETNARQPADISYLLDEDPNTGSPTYTSIAANIADPFLRSTVDSPFQPTHVSGVNLIEKWYYLRDKSGARRVAVRLDWAASTTPFKLFSIMTVASRNGGS